MARGLVDGVEDGEVPDALVVQLLYQSAAGPAKLVLYRRCHHVSAAASMAWCVRSR